MISILKRLLFAVGIIFVAWADLFHWIITGKPIGEYLDRFYKWAIREVA